MWILNNSKGAIYYLLPGKHIVGRKQCDLILENDQSISRKHSLIEVHHPPENWNKVEWCPVVELTDCGSKYGTALNRKDTKPMKISKDMKIKLNDGDIIHFGQQWNKWSVHFKPLVVTVSGLSRQEKESVKAIVVQLGGHVVNDWHSEVSYLTMSSITMTAKAISAFATATPIVTSQFWEHFKSAIKEGTNIPKYEDYIPSLAETSINKHEVSCNVNVERKTLFKGKTFYFFSPQQFKEHGCLVTAAGGAVKLLQFEEMEKDNFIVPDIIIMQYLQDLRSQSTQLPEEFIEITSYLKSHGKRPIPSSEIGLAILHCSLEKFCNPDFNFSSLLLRHSENPSQNLKDKILAAETQESMTLNISIHKNIVIPDSGTESRIQVNSTFMNPLPICSKQHNQKSDLEEMSVAELDQNVLSCDSPVTNASSSRKRVRIINDEDDSDENPFCKKVSLKSKIEVCRKNTHHSRNEDNDDSDDPDKLFEDFKDSQTKGKSSQSTFIASQETNKTSKGRKKSLLHFEEMFKNNEGNEVDITTQNTLPCSSLSSSSSSLKRVLPKDEAIGPPSKRFAEMNISTTKASNNIKGSCESQEEFISVGDIKKDNMNSSENSFCNVSVKVKPLVKKNNTTISSVSELSYVESGTNFKRFKKVQPLSNSLLPRIIGGQDLSVYRNISVNSLLEESRHHLSEEDDDRPDDLWSRVTKIQTRKGHGRRL